mgnify:CR=1 FL=1
MIFFSSFFQFNSSPTFNLGFYLGNCLNQKLFGNFWKCSPWFSQPTCFMMPNTSFFTPYMDNISTPPLMTGFDTFSYSGGNSSCNFGTWNNFGEIAFTMQTYNTSKSKKKVGNTADLKWWTAQGYCKEKGEKLAKISEEYTRFGVNNDGTINKNKKKNPDEFTHNCAKYVKSAIEESGLGDYENGNACDMPEILRKNKKFKEISPDGVDLKALPAGCVLCYNKGSQGYSSEYGHVEISQGDGTATSDGTTHYIKKPDVIFIPV